MHKPFVIIIKFHNGRQIVLEEHMRSRAQAIAKEYRSYGTVKSAVIYQITA